MKYRSEKGMFLFEKPNFISPPNYTGTENKHFGRHSFYEVLSIEKQKFRIKAFLRPKKGVNTSKKSPFKYVLYGYDNVIIFHTAR